MIIWLSDTWFFSQKKFPVQLTPTKSVVFIGGGGGGGAAEVVAMAPACRTLLAVTTPTRGSCVQHQKLGFLRGKIVVWHVKLAVLRGHKRIVLHTFVSSKYLWLESSFKRLPVWLRSVD